MDIGAFIFYLAFVDLNIIRRSERLIPPHYSH